MAKPISDEAWQRVELLVAADIRRQLRDERTQLRSPSKLTSAPVAAAARHVRHADAGSDSTADDERSL